MNPYARALTAGVEAGHGRLTPHVRADAAHHIVGGRRNGNRFLGDVDTVIETVLVDLREPGAHPIGGQVSYVQIDLVGARFR